jgi:hypothetical protein
MKKVVLISDGKNFSDSTFNYIQSLYEKEPFLLAGAFFHSVNYSMLVPATFATDAGPFLAFPQEDHEAYEQGIQRFELLCNKNYIEYVVHKESEEWNTDDLVKESRFADVFVVSGELFFSDFAKVQPNKYLRTVLSNAECPVLVIPEDANPIKRIGIAYDGKKESMFAMKMFCYNFPQLTNLPVDIYYWVSKTDDEIPDMEYLQEFARRHFIDLNFREMFFDPQKYLGSWASNYKDTLFVCGSYHRSKFSTMFRKSFAEDIITQHSAAVLIAHTF